MAVEKENEKPDDKVEENEQVDDEACGHIQDHAPAEIVLHVVIWQPIGEK